MSYTDQTTVNQGTGPVDETLRTDNILDTAKNMPEISRFVENIRAAGLESGLRGPDFKTVFAPFNEAMHKDLDADRIARHIVLGSQTEADLRTASGLQTVSGEVLEVEFGSDRFTRVGGANIIRRDVPCVNGHIQVIDKVLA
jgi:uncharacterized surface protein with fasciclin (FAS1) repeats